MRKLPDSHPFLEHWRALAQEIEHPHFELDVEAFAEIHRAYLNLQSAGYEHDVMLSALMKQLASQCFSGDALEDGGDEYQMDNSLVPFRAIAVEGSVKP